ncbi:MAG TPA: hypothetical protein VMV29_04400 [Ktedonobacterales bacterium]|nr:hypothetical protein [Ktedonobacterales bacterium]
MGARRTRDDTQHAQHDTPSSTDVSLREYVTALIAANDVRYSQRFDASQAAISAAFLAQQTAMSTALAAQKLAVDTALQAADRAGAKSEIAADKRFNDLNELRGMVTDQQALFMQRLEAMALFNAIDAKITALQVGFESKMEAQRLTFEASLANATKEIASLRESRAQTGGGREQSRELWAYLLGAIGATSTIILLILRLTGH